ncbi:MAG: glycosyltransferase family 4 protein, partial [Chloroflexota bacterium]|nr:glycosyltransferase family 4 protein [Chloroflexota bacterium]
PGEHEYTVFVNGQDVVTQLGAYDPQITYIPVSWSESQPATRIIWEQFTLPSILRQRRIEVLHSPVNVLPEFLPAHCAGVVTLHDLAFLRFPEVLTRPKRVYHRTFTIRSLRRATRVIAVSESTKSDAVKLVNIPAERIQTIYPCIDPRFSNVPEEDDLHSFRQKHGLSNGFLLYLGTLEPRKNIPTLLDAYARLRQRYQIAEKLVIAGSKGWLYDTIFAKVQQLGLQDEVLFVGYVEDAEQVLWYASASAFVYPSLYEGFGLPVAEAAACGTPVVTSDVSSLPEAGGKLALTVNPLDADAMATALYTAITDRPLRQKCRTMASSVAQQFSPQRMVAQTIQTYEQTATVFMSQERSQRMSFVR